MITFPVDIYIIKNMNYNIL